MSFQPVVPFGGFVGWQFLQRTIETQKAAFDASPTRQRDVDYFRERIGEITSAEALVGDRRLLGVALGAFGLDDDINNRFFIGKVLGDGIANQDALANRLADQRYFDLSEAFGFGNDLPPNTLRTGFADRIAEAFLERQFEIGVGNSNEAMRLALGLQREVPELAGREVGNDTKWFTVMGTPPLRSVFETALGFPPSFGALDIDRQLVEFKDRAESALGITDFAELAAPDKQDELLRLFLARSELNGSAFGGGSVQSTALTLLSQANRSSLFNLI